MVALVRGDDSDLFSSTEDLARLLHTENTFVQQLRDLTANLEKDLNILRTFLDTHYKEDRVTDGITYVSNPLNSLYLIRRLSLDFGRSEVAKVLENNQTEELRLSLQNLTHSFPGTEDWMGAANGIFLLQEHYDLNITKLAAGVIEFEGKQAGEIDNLPNIKRQSVTMVAGIPLSLSLLPFILSVVGRLEPRIPGCK